MRGSHNRARKVAMESVAGCLRWAVYKEECSMAFMRGAGWDRKLYFLGRVGVTCGASIFRPSTRLVVSKIMFVVGSVKTLSHKFV